MGDLIIPKNDGRLEYFDESIKIVSENGGFIFADKFVEREKQLHPDIDETSCYHKIVMARYFGMILFNQYNSIYFLTESGTKYSRANTPTKKIDAILQALTAVSFGRNNNAVSSNSDVEAPIVFLKAIKTLKSASINELGCIIYYMDTQNISLEEAIKITKGISNLPGVRKDIESLSGGHKYFDLKFNKLFEDLGIIKKEQGNYVLSEYVKSKHADNIEQLAELKRINSAFDNEDNGIIVPFSNEWFVKKSKESNYASVDVDATALREKFMDAYGIDGLASLLEKEKVISDVISIGTNRNNYLFYFVNQEPTLSKYFGSCNSSPKVSILLHYDTGTKKYSYNGNELTYEDAESICRSIVETLKEITELTATKSLEKLNDYDQFFTSVVEIVKDKECAKSFLTNDNAPKQWVMKYLNILYPNKFCSFYAVDSWLVPVTNALKIECIEQSYKELTGRVCIKLNSISTSTELSKAVIYRILVENIEKTDQNSYPDEEKTYLECTGNPEQVIYYGAPGTGKSYTIDEKIKSKHNKDPEYFDEHVTRVVFHPDYSYSDFVGSVRPVRDDSTGKLDYPFIAGPFTIMLSRAFSNPGEQYYLVLEEINRGNASAIFGDLFQLLDRDESKEHQGRSKYKIKNHEIASFVQYNCEINLFENDSVWLPSNFNILCTMNTADQNVFVLDSAFKRRFSLKYVSIDFSVLNENEHLDLLKEQSYFLTGNISDLSMRFKNKRIIDTIKDINPSKMNWPVFAQIVNAIIDDINSSSGVEQISEDKKLGPFFVTSEDLIDREAFVNKVIYYLKQDVFKYADFYFTDSFQQIFKEYGIGSKDIVNLLIPNGEELTDGV